MGKYLLNRILQTLVVLLIVTTAVFFMVNLLPGDPVYIYAQSDTISPEQYNIIHHQLKLDQPLWERYITWVTDVCKGDFGISYKYHIPVWELIGSRIGITLFLSTLSMLISMPLGILFGILTAIKRNSKIDTIITLIANITGCLPVFWVGICLIYVFSLNLHWLPSTGFFWPWEDPIEHLRHLVMPLSCLSLMGIAFTTRQTRSSMLEVIRQDYIRTARAKGLPEKKVITVHMLKNALIPIVTLFGMRLAHMIGGSMFVETVFNIPGMGTLIINCISFRDIPTVQALVLLTAVACSIAFIITDLMYVIVDPRISLTAKE
jgi:peptide/nickel transport system permease protein